MSDDLVNRLSIPQRVIVGGNAKSFTDLKHQIELRHVAIKFFTESGSTDLRFRLDKKNSDLSNADFKTGSGAVHIEGYFTLNSIEVCCAADINLKDIQGVGYLTPV